MTRITARAPALVAGLLLAFLQSGAVQAAPGGFAKGADINNSGKPTAIMDAFLE